MKKIPVKHDDIIIGYTFDEGKTIEFLDNDEAIIIKNKLSISETVYVSSRRFGTVSKDNIVNMEELKELSIINML